MDTPLKRVCSTILSKVTGILELIKFSDFYDLKIAYDNNENSNKNCHKNVPNTTPALFITLPSRETVSITQGCRDRKTAQALYVTNHLF